jgi:transcriptional regulator GlxA family with amidase domain
MGSHVAPSIKMQEVPLPEKDKTETPSQELSDLYEKVLRLFQEDKIHLKPDLSVDALAEKLGIGTRKLTQVLKSAGDTSYTQLVNQFRISEATRLLEDPASSHYKLDTIATMSGFTNRQHFRRVFEQVTGVNPGYYRDNTKQHDGMDSSDSVEN